MIRRACALGIVMCALTSLTIALILPLPLFEAKASSKRGAQRQPCPSGAIAIAPGDQIQTAVDRAPKGATFCLQAGTHRMQAIVPQSGQKFFGDGRTILSGARRLNGFWRDGDQYVAEVGSFNRRRPRGECTKEAPACDESQGLFIDDVALSPVMRRHDVTPGRFYFDPAAARVYFADDPHDKVVEIAISRFAFESRAANVTIANMTIEKYASLPQQGAIQAQDAVGWTIENCELRLNSAAGISAGRRTRILNSKVHRNGQIGITGAGDAIVVENNEVSANNTRGYEYGWEGGGVKLVLGKDITFRDNDVHDNAGPGLWCDGECSGTVYEGNRVERNQGAGIFHEISYSALIRDNVVEYNGSAGGWFWGSGIIVAASEGVTVVGNRLKVSAGKCGIMLIDQGRDDRPGRRKGPLYRTTNNLVKDNETVFEGRGCAGGASDVPVGHESYALIETGNNVFDGNVYRVPNNAEPDLFAWGHREYEWNDVRSLGFEPTGRLIRH